MKRLGCILLILILCLGAVACSASAPDTTPAQTTPAQTTPVAVQTTPAPDPMLTLVSNGQCDYTIVRPEGTNSAIIKAAQDIQAHLMTAAQNRPPIREDWVKPDQAPDTVSQYEILIGGTNRSADDIECDGGWYVTVKDDRIIILADRAVYYPAAVEYLISNLQTSEGTMKVNNTLEHFESVADSYTNVTTTLRVASYNIKHGGDVGLDMSVIAADITALSLDIVGLQEIDQLTSRVNGLDTMKALSDASGYQYYAFAKAISYKGGEYGTGVLSRYPIVSFEVIKLESGDKEQRCVGHAVIDVDGVLFDFFNTHLSFESLELRRGQFAHLATLLGDCETYILTGDFNTADMTEFDVLPDVTLVNSGKFGTFPSSGKAIDNIAISRDWNVVSADMGPLGHSDHRMLWAELKFERK